MTDSPSAQVAPSRRWLGILALVVSGLLAVLTVVLTVTAIVYAINGAGSTVVLAAVYALLVLLLPVLIAVGLGLWAFFRARPRWMGTVAMLLGGSPVILFAVILLVGLIAGVVMSAGM
ncbi:hypothetical protein J2Y69_002797 [Microbacterium resistens]|uniref:Bacitracin resistance protein n=1 Tax=Microbacterium resistens TaxID=156977 RepID=A0ABU1SF20_9MICO|nr:hypothetical protein [Microbacterium resistens]MDR6868186.1 hypothetical protein [Microbacterium resistens]